MIRFLSIDNGNTSVKLTLFTDGVPMLSRRFSYGDAIGDLQPFKADAALCCSVGRKVHPKLEKKIVEIVASPVLKLTHATAIPISIEYKTYDSLGLDRIAAALGASSLFPGETLLVADAGTALTLDIVTASPAFIGGNISPGMELRFSSLHEHTSLLPQADAVSVPERFGHDTLGAIRAGVEWGMASEIDCAAIKAAEIYGASRLVLTGGDAGILVHLLNIGSMKLSVADNLVAHGLYRIYTYNENQ